MFNAYTQDRRVRFCRVFDCFSRLASTRSTTTAVYRSVYIELLTNGLRLWLIRTHGVRLWGSAKTSRTYYYTVSGKMTRNRILNTIPLYECKYVVWKIFTRLIRMGFRMWKRVFVCGSLWSWRLFMHKLRFVNNDTMVFLWIGRKISESLNDNYNYNLRSRL